MKWKTNCLPGLLKAIEVSPYSPKLGRVLSPKHGQSWVAFGLECKWHKETHVKLRALYRKWEKRWHQTSVFCLGILFSPSLWWCCFAYLCDLANGWWWLFDGYLFYPLLNYTRHQLARSVLFQATNHILLREASVQGEVTALTCLTTYTQQPLRATQWSLRGRKGDVC